MITITRICRGKRFDPNNPNVDIEFRRVESIEAERVVIENGEMTLYQARVYLGFGDISVELKHYDAVYIDGLKVYPE